MHGTDGEKRELYEHFLSEFPLCWGYWKRLAELETRTSGVETGLNVYVKALKLTPACVDLWVHYCQAASSTVKPGDLVAEDGMRQLFEKAVETVGTDWRAFPLWDLYMNFEETHSRWKRLGSLRRAVVVPMEGLPAVRVRLRALVVGDAAPPLEELCDDAESDLMDVEMPQDFDPQVITVSLEAHVPKAPPAPPAAPGPVPPEAPAAPAAPAVPPAPAVAEEGAESELEEGEILEPEQPEPNSVILPVEEGEEIAGEPEDARAPEPPELAPGEPVAQVAQAEAPGPSTSRAKSNKFLTDRAQRFLQIREKLWATTAEEAAALRAFEVPLQRHYFHQKPLSNAQLEGWRRFLDFEESREPRDWRRLQILFERCLIVTNNYLEFWLRYANLLEQAEIARGAPDFKPEISCGLLRGACLSGRLSRRPDALAAWAELEESCGRVDRARVLMDATLIGCGHGSTDLALRRASLELRYNEDAQAAATLLDTFAKDAVDLASKAVLSRRYARLCQDRLNESEKACQSLLATWHAGCRDLGLLLELTSLLMRQSPQKAASAGGGFSYLKQSCILFEEALQCMDGTALPEACELWSCYVDFLLSHGAPLQQLRDVQARARAYRSKASVQRADAENRKRSLQPGLPATTSCKQAKVV